MTTRPTPAQDRAVQIVARDPGILQWEAAAEVGPHGSNRYGTDTLLRAVAAGRLVRVAGTSPHNGQRCWHYYTPEDVPEEHKISEIRAQAWDSILRRDTSIS